VLQRFGHALQNGCSPSRQRAGRLWFISKHYFGGHLAARLLTWLRAERDKFAIPTDRAQQHDASNLQVGGESHDQARQPLRKLWWQVWTCLLPPLGAPFLSQSLQGRVPCENSQRACTHEKVVWLVSSRHDVVDESRTETVRYSK